VVALLIGLIVAVAKMPHDHPLKRVLTALSYRVGATAAAGALAIPVEPVPGLDVAYDIVVPVLLLIYWVSFFGNTGRTIWNVGPSRDLPAGPQYMVCPFLGTKRTEAARS
jgi:hypothetical protein